MKILLRFSRCLVLASLLVFVCQSSQAQFLKRLKDKVTQTAADHVTNDAGNATDKSIDKTEGAATKSGNSSSANNSSNSSAGNSASSSSGNASAPPSIKTYKNYDFVPFHQE